MSKKKKTSRIAKKIFTKKKTKTKTKTITKTKTKMRKMIVAMKKVTKMDIADAETTNVLKDNGSVMINKTQFEFGLSSRCAKNLDKMTNNTDTLTVQLNCLLALAQCSFFLCAADKLYRLRMWWQQF